MLVNPWIYDFAAYDFWLRPYGLLRLGGLLRREGYRVKLLDLLDPFHPALPRKPKRRAYGTGHFWREEVPKPIFFEDVPRHWARYGLPRKPAEKELADLPTPKVILLTCLLTYWYPGALEAFRLLRRRFPKTPVLLGGVYPRLCPDHALRTFPEAELITEFSEKKILERIREICEPEGEPHSHSFPVFDLQREIPYVVLLTGKGCPFRCPYCATPRLFPGLERRSPKEVLSEILYWHKHYGVIDFVFYDDALLVDFENHLAIVLEGLLSAGIRARFHTPNALHARFINRKVAGLLKRSGFVTLRLGLETLGPRIDQKVTEEEFLQAVAYLREAGFTARELGAYLLFGLPEQSLAEVKKAAEFVANSGAKPVLAEFSPIPNTPLFEEAARRSRYPLHEDPLFHNNSVFPALKSPDWEAIEELKRYVRRLSG